MKQHNLSKKCNDLGKKNIKGMLLIQFYDILSKIIDYFISNTLIKI
jgi:hypothetical protein